MFFYFHVSISPHIPAAFRLVPQSCTSVHSIVTRQTFSSTRLSRVKLSSCYASLSSTFIIKQALNARTLCTIVTNVMWLVRIVKVVNAMVGGGFVENVGGAGVFVVIEVNPHIVLDVAVVCA